ncbi:MAG: GNAT family N-acetyltransferase [Candidatus Hydrogenedentes bacterium]|jgi:RimJ/RimL family protein N-acetyltransferase|nr:GNAT family N-acetyltransferase [Candidatus Hydrogenedentota bacterium]
MILGTHTRIRFSEGEDASFYRNLYLTNEPKAALLDARREYGMPVRHEIEELLRKSESSRAYLFTVEDLEGQRRGWCGLRGLNVEAGYCELFLVFRSDEEFLTPMADEALAMLLYRAFQQLRLNKVLVFSLKRESGLQQCLMKQGFRSCGIQRDVLYSGGTWHNLNTFVLPQQAYDPETAQGKSGEIEP